MFYRRKIIMALLQVFNGELEKIPLQKLLFLFTQRQNTEKVYDFIPYKFGGFSYSANADMTAMAGKGLLQETDHTFKKQDSVDYLLQLRDSDRRSLQEIKQLYGNMSNNTLIRHTYTNFPYLAINSLMAKNLLSAEALKKVEDARPKSDKTVLFTIGYEGISLEEYLNRLIKNDVRILVDVRNNPMSMKYGFNKNQLNRYCENLGIKYIHFPEVGIQSEQRQSLQAQTDYDKLFAAYRKDNLTKTQDTQNAILELLIQHQRIALTCFEANICQCHRKHLAEAITKLPGWRFELKHI
ncbi:hypothetical protein A9P82_05750 [Arachidicoccus ginsenosidimutans]|uniref:DUF488 domain-containing protein n=1 Tax=Arachidicoccus sp. BS20 TaxID=1850526 RepID=UPI0007F14C2F|nr:DUF488 domain-containing protein [Arachidicoccus sp. BS20]ANI88835.1 hypothetical protein A9P82_05750 [Arachidicoccus sp. BS20]